MAKKVTIALGGNCQKVTGNSTTMTTENLTTNAKVRLRIRVQTGKGTDAARHALLSTTSQNSTQQHGRGHCSTCSPSSLKPASLKIQIGRAWRSNSQYPITERTQRSNQVWVAGNKLSNSRKYPSLLGCKRQALRT